MRSDESFPRPEDWDELMEGRLTEEARASWRVYLSGDPKAFQEWDDQWRMARELEDFPRAAGAEALALAEHVIRVGGEGEGNFAERVKGRVRQAKRRRLGAWLALTACAAAAAAVWLSAPWRQEVGVMVRLDERSGETQRRKIFRGERIRSEDGLIRLEFDQGTVLSMAGAADLTIELPTAVKIAAGSFNGWCPERARGFRVSTPGARMTDWGTSFGVSVSDEAGSEFVVFDGRIRVETERQRQWLDEGGAVALSGEERWEEVAIDPKRYRRAWVFNHGIVATRGAVVPADPDVPSKLAQRESDDQVMLIPERRSVRLERPLPAELVAPGILPWPEGGKRRRTFEPAPEGRYSSFLLRYDPVGESAPDEFIQFEGEVTFDRPVLAIMGLRESLEASDGPFATGSWAAVHRGIELRQIRQEPDRVELSEDRRTVKIRFYAGASTDEIRVIVEDP